MMLWGHAQTPQMRGRILHGDTLPVTAASLAPPAAMRAHCALAPGRAGLKLYMSDIMSDSSLHKVRMLAAWKSHSSVACCAGSRKLRFEA